MLEQYSTIRTIFESEHSLLVQAKDPENRTVILKTTPEDRPHPDAMARPDALMYSL